MRKLFVLLAFTSFSLHGLCQNYALVFPNQPDWNVIKEGELVEFKLKTNPASDSITYSLNTSVAGMSLKSEGNFSWKPSRLDAESGNAEAMFIAKKGDQVVAQKLVIFTINKKQPIPSSNLPLELSRLEIVQRPSWNLLKEGDNARLKIKAFSTTGKEMKVRYYIEEGEKSTLTVDSIGLIQWTPPYDYVDRLEQTREKHFFIIGEDENGNLASEKIVFTVFHKNQAPVVRPIPPIYVLLGTNNTFFISNEQVEDPDQDPIVYLVRSTDLPEGMDFSSSGKITWSPSRSQFNSLRNNSLKIPFIVEDQPAKGRAEGTLIIEASSMDMPPEITLIPSESAVKVKENERMHLIFHLSDPNGDEDIDQFSFVSEDERLSPELLVKNTNNQYEFVWSPGFDFVNDPERSKEFEIRFFVLDKSRKMTEKILSITVEDTEDLSKKDTENSIFYKEVLTDVLNLMDQLEENQKALEKEMKLAKKGKKNRALVNASIGAITGLSPVISQDETQKMISVIGGTSTLTLGTLEARDVIGKSVTAINDQLKLNAELYNQFLSEGISFARRYNSKAARRDQNFTFDLEKIKKLLISPKLSMLELDAGWENNKKVTSRRLKSVFTDYDMEENQ